MALVLWGFLLLVGSFEETGLLPRDDSLWFTGFLTRY
jgi:hypothetical protein